MASLRPARGEGELSTLQFLNENRLIHQVRLVGLENEWRETQIAEARYPALAAGVYRFEVRSRYPDGEPGPAACQAFEILPPWWGTWWFRALAGAGVLSLAGFLYRWRVRRLFNRTLTLEAMVQARTESLELANRALEQATLVDPLTGLYNRRFLDLSLPTDALQAQRAFREILGAGKDPLLPKEDLLLFMMDIDHFKQVNDTYGHLAGDAVLQQLAIALQKVIRATDSLVRWGGEEFLLVARRTRRTGAPKIAQTLSETVRGLTFELPGGERIRKQLSIGFTAMPMHPLHPDFGSWQLALELADQCLYAAKETGRDRWVGALLKAEQDPTVLEQHGLWDIPLADQYGLVDLFSSQADFSWPSR